MSDLILPPGVRSGEVEFLRKKVAELEAKYVVMCACLVRQLGNFAVVTQEEVQSIRTWQIGMADRPEDGAKVFSVRPPPEPEAPAEADVEVPPPGEPS